MSSSDDEHWPEHPDFPEWHIWCAQGIWQARRPLSSPQYYERAETREELIAEIRRAERDRAEGEYHQRKIAALNADDPEGARQG